ncbi:hypothetical protein [Amycolatopsis sp. NPDC003731]
MSQPILFPDAEDLLVDYLTAEFAERAITATAHTKVPNPRPTKFVLVPRVGGVRRNIVVDAPTIGFEVWADRDKAASDLAQITRALVNGMAGRRIGGVQCYRVEELAGPTNFPDGVSAQSRYVFTTTLSFRGTVL